MLCYRPSVCRLSVFCRLVCLSSETLVHPTQAVAIFRQYFYAIWYLGYPLTSTENLWRSSQGKPYVGELKPTGVAKYSDFGPIEGYISETMQDKR